MSRIKLSNIAERPGNTSIQHLNKFHTIIIPVLILYLTTICEFEIPTCSSNPSSAQEQHIQIVFISLLFAVGRLLTQP